MTYTDNAADVSTALQWLVTMCYDAGCMRQPVHYITVTADYLQQCAPVF